MSEWDSEYFQRAEFACKCGCGFDTIDYETLKVLTYIREHFDRPVRINSGCRCPDHNLAVGGSTGSQHLLGRACDITVDGIDPQIVYELADQMEVGGLGEYSNFTHIDTRVGYARW
jgi:uncharacterized protein YcbK (DUF882 family)